MNQRTQDYECGNSRWTRCVGISTVLAVLVSGEIEAETKTPQPHIIIHRQALQAAPQNRWAALRQAVRWGADETVTLEVDLHATKDGRLILFHDPWFDGQNEELLGPTTGWLWEEINDVDFGSWYDHRFKGERLALFEDVLEFCKLNHVRLTLDVKETVTPEMVRAVLKKHDAEKLVYWGWRGGFGRLVGTQIKIMGYDGDRELVRRAAKSAAGNTIWVDDPRVLLDVLHREVRKREVKIPTLSCDYRVKDLDFDALVTQVRAGGDAGRIAAARLRKHFKERARVAFTAILSDELTGPQAKTTAARALGRLGNTLQTTEEAAKRARILETLLTTREADLRAAAAYALGKLKHEPAAPRLIEILRDRKEPDKVRMEVARGLGRIGSRRVVRPLIETAARERQTATREILPQFAERSKEEGLYRALPQVLSACYWALGEIGGEQALEFLLGQYRDQELTGRDALLETVFVRQAALRAALRIGGAKALAAAKDQAWAPPFDTYVDYLRLTRDSVPQEVVPVLLEFLGHPKVFQRQEAFYALLRIGEPSVEPLIGLLRDKQAAPLAREWAAWTLGWTNDRRAVAPLTEALHDNVPGVRAKAAWAMGKMRLGGSAGRLKELTKDTDLLVREYASEALVRFAARVDDWEESER